MGCLLSLQKGNPSFQLLAPGDSSLFTDNWPVLWKGSLRTCFIFLYVLTTRFEPSCRACIELSCTCQRHVIYQVILTFLYLYFRSKSCKEVGGINQIMRLWTTLSPGCQRWVPFSIILCEGGIARDLYSKNERRGCLPGN